MELEKSGWMRSEMESGGTVKGCGSHTCVLERLVCLGGPFF